MGPGEIIGEISFIDEEKSTATVIAVEDTLVLKLPKHSLRDKLTKFQILPQISYKSLAHVLANRLRKTMDELTFTKDSQKINKEYSSKKEFAVLFNDLHEFKVSMADISKSQKLTADTATVTERFFKFL